jgi:hypothetical protein
VALPGKSEDAREYVVNSDGSNLHEGTLQNTYTDAECPTESPDEEWHVFVSDDGDAYVTNRDESVLYQLTDTSAEDDSYGPIIDVFWLR